DLDDGAGEGTLRRAAGGGPTGGWAPRSGRRYFMKINDGSNPEFGGTAPDSWRTAVPGGGSRPLGAGIQSLGERGVDTRDRRPATLCGSRRMLALASYQTRWTAAGGFAYPIGYGVGAGGPRLPEFDWSVRLVFIPASLTWKSLP